MKMKWNERYVTSDASCARGRKYARGMVNKRNLERDDSVLPNISKKFYVSFNCFFSSW
jgi:hypothetical protein